MPPSMPKRARSACSYGRVARVRAGARACRSEARTVRGARSSLRSPTMGGASIRLPYRPGILVWRSCASAPTPSARRCRSAVSPDRAPRSSQHGAVGVAAGVRDRPPRSTRRWHLMGEPSPTCIRVVLVDDHPMVRMGLRLSLLSTEGIDVVGEAEDGEEALRVCAELHPDVVLMDLRLPGLEGAATTWALQGQVPVPRGVVLTAAYDDGLIPDALTAGASAYVIKL